MIGLSETFILNNSYKIPCVGFGTWQTPDGRMVIESVKSALKIGYRHIDTAAAYGNEKGIGQAIKETELLRNELFITSKIWNTERGYDKTMKAFEKTLANLDIDYLDLYLIHWPASASQFTDWKKINQETWRAMMELYKTGRVKAIGVSNFLPHHLEGVMESEFIPMVNQIEFHPGYMQKETVAYCKKNGILVEAWSPLGTGRMLNNQTLIRIAEKYHKTAAQICLRWCLQHDILPLPKSVTPSRIVENSRIFDFEIALEDMVLIDSLSDFGSSGLNPDQIDF